MKWVNLVILCWLVSFNSLYTLSDRRIEIVLITFLGILILMVMVAFNASLENLPEQAETLTRVPAIAPATNIVRENE